MSVPNEPTSVIATPGNAQATVSWNAPETSTTGFSNVYISTSGMFTTVGYTGSLPQIPSPFQFADLGAGGFSAASIQYTGEEAIELQIRFSGEFSSSEERTLSFDIVDNSFAIFANVIERFYTININGSTVVDTGYVTVTLQQNWKIRMTSNAPDGGLFSSGGSFFFSIPIIFYTVTSNPGAFTSSTTNGTTTNTVVTGLTNGTAYTFTVVATNTIGNSGPSAASNSVTPLGVPSPPTGVTATAGNGQAVVFWTAPESDGGAFITSYTVTSNPGALTATTNATTTNAVFTGLTNGIAYTFTVVATNSQGASGVSLASNSVTPTSISSRKFNQPVVFTGSSINIGSLYVSGGNIGIGCTNPGNILSIEGVGGTTGALSFHNSSLSVPYVGLGYNETADGLAFYYNNGTSFDNTSVFINRSGNVGIGTESPNHKLHVAGDIYATNRLLSAGLSVFGDGGLSLGHYDGLNAEVPNVFSVFAGDNHYTSYWGHSFQIGAGGAGDNPNASQTRIPNTSSFTVNKWVSSGTYQNLFTIRNSGNVGIGTTAPGVNLEIKSNAESGNYITVLSALAPLPGIQTPILFGHDMTAFFNSAGLYFNFISHANPENSAAFALPGSNGLTINGYGNVGIGMYPQVKLDVSGDCQVSGYLRPSAGNGANGIIFPDNPGGDGGDTAWIKYYLRSGEAATLEIGTSNDADDHIFLNPSGNVGIGTDSPGYKLQVEGSGSFASMYGNAFNVFKGNGNNVPGSLFQQSADNSWGMCAEYRTIDNGSDRPSIGFSSYLTGTTWSIGYVAHDDNFRISQNHGHRHDSWGTQRFVIDTSGNVYTIGRLSVGSNTPAGSLDIDAGLGYPLVRGVANSNGAKSYMNGIGSGIALLPVAAGNMVYLYYRTNTTYQVELGGNAFFTGQHANVFEEEEAQTEKYEGLIVCSADSGYHHVNPITGNVSTGKDAILITEALPYIKLCTKAYDKSVWGVISNHKNEHYDSDGIMILDTNKEWGNGLENRVRVNGLGEGGIWVCNINGNLENGDYITSSDIPGYGMYQESPYLCNFTVAKITCSVDFNKEDLHNQFQTRYIDLNGNIVDDQTYLLNKQSYFVAVFAGCSYHCS